MGDFDILTPNPEQDKLGLEGVVPLAAHVMGLKYLFVSENSRRDAYNYTGYRMFLSNNMSWDTSRTAMIGSLVDYFKNSRTPTNSQSIWNLFVSSESQTQFAKDMESALQSKVSVSKEDGIDTFHFGSEGIAFPVWLDATQYMARKIQLQLDGGNPEEHANIFEDPWFKKNDRKLGDYVYLCGLLGFDYVGQIMEGLASHLGDESFDQVGNMADSLFNKVRETGKGRIDAPTYICADYRGVLEQRKFLHSITPMMLESVLGGISISSNLFIGIRYTHTYSLTLRVAAFHEGIKLLYDEFAQKPIDSVSDGVGRFLDSVSSLGIENIQQYYLDKHGLLPSSYFLGCEVETHSLEQY